MPSTSSAAKSPAVPPAGPGVMIPFPLPVPASLQMARHHLPTVAAFYGRENGFHLLDYFHQLGPALEAVLATRFSRREFYRALTVGQEHPLPVSYSYFTRVLAAFRAEKGLAPARRGSAPAEKAAAPTPLAPVHPPMPAAGEADPAPPVPLPAAKAASRDPEASPPFPAASKPAPAPVPPPSPTPELPVPPPPSANAPEPDHTPYNPPLFIPGLDAEVLAEARRRRFPAFTQEDLKGKPLSEVVADQQRQGIADFERELNLAPPG